MADLSIGKAQTKPPAPSHVRGVREANQPGALQKQDGVSRKGMGAVASARRSTGICPEDREPIDSEMPHLTPA